MPRQCWGLLSVLALLSACWGGDGGRTARGEPWDIGSSVGEHFGPFPEVVGDPPEPDHQTTPDGWVAVVVPSGDPLDAFYDIVDDAVDRGFTASARRGGACRHHWRREGVPAAETKDDLGGQELGGEVQIGAPLPVDARVVGVNCTAVVSRSDDRLNVQMMFFEDAGSSVLSGSGVWLSPRTADAPTGRFARQDVGVDLTLATDRPAGQGLSYPQLPDVPGMVSGWVFAFGLGCSVAGFGDSIAPAEAVSRVMKAHYFKDFLTDEPTATTVGDREAAVMFETVPAGGGTVAIAAVRTNGGTDLLLCSRG